MVKILESKKYRCDICDKIYTTADEARKCQEGHDIVYIPIERSDLKRLIQFIYTKEELLLTQNLMNTLQKYSRIKSE